MLITWNQNTPTLKLLFEERPKVCPLVHVHSKNYKLIGDIHELSLHSFIVDNQSLKFRIDSSNSQGLFPMSNVFRFENLPKYQFPIMVHMEALTWRILLMAWPVRFLGQKLQRVAFQDVISYDGNSQPEEGIKTLIIQKHIFTQLKLRLKQLKLSCHRKYSTIFANM